MEVASWTGFDQELIHASTNKPPNEEKRSYHLSVC